jgi:hypothetical protein
MEFLSVIPSQRGISPRDSSFLKIEGHEARFFTRVQNDRLEYSKKIPFNPLNPFVPLIQIPYGQTPSLR